MSIAMVVVPSAFEASARVVNRSLSRVQSEVNAGDVPVAQTPDTLNILSARPSGSEENVTVLSSGVRITGLHSGKKVEGTLTYKRGYYI